MKTKNNSRRIKVVSVEESDPYDIIEFEEDWFFEGETVQNAKKKDFDITLVKQLTDTKFEFAGQAKPGEEYHLKSD